MIRVFRLQMTLKLIPVKLRLLGLVTLEVNLLFVKIKKTLYQKTLWQYTAPTLEKRIIDKHTKDKDLSPPAFAPVITKKV